MEIFPRPTKIAGEKHRSRLRQVDSRTVPTSRSVREVRRRARNAAVGLFRTDRRPSWAPVRQQPLAGGPNARILCDVIARLHIATNRQQKEMVRRVRDAIERLPDHERDVIVMRHYEGLSNQDIGVILNIEPATVSKRHGRAMLRLHEMLFAEEKEVDQ